MNKLLYVGKMVKEDNVYVINFIDFELSSYGDTPEEALECSQEALEGYLLTQQDYNEELPVPTKFEDIVEDGRFIPFIVDLNLVRARLENTFVKKTVTIPSYLNDLGKFNKVNFSELLANSLRAKLIGNTNHI